MRMINICTHPIHGRCFLWEKGEMNYRIGTVATNYMKFDGWTLEEVVKAIEKKDFRIVPWASEDEI